MKKTYIGRYLPLIKNFNKLLLIMKLSSILLFIIVFQATATIYSQKLSVNLENQSLRDVLKTIESESNYRFFYNDQLSGLNQKVTLKAENRTIRELLDQLLADHQFSYKILENNMVVVAPREFIQQQQVTGKITDEDGTGLPGVNVIEKGTTNGTITDEDGNYILTVSDANAVLVFSYIGYLTEEALVGNQTLIDISLVPDIASLEEVVVVGYGSVKKSDITGSVASVGLRELEQGTVIDPLEAMQGRAAGVDITSVARPGEVGIIRIRGERSIVDPNGPPTVANDPLFVVDGIPMAVTTRRISSEYIGGEISDEDLTHNPIANLNPNDIESIEILKDASATAIYGSRATNGVVLITTKRGKSGKTSITYDASLTFEKFDERLELFDADGQFGVYREVYRHLGSYNTPYNDPANDFIMLMQRDFESWESIAMGYEWEDMNVIRDAWNQTNMGLLTPVMRPTTPEEQELWGVDEVPVYNPENVRETDWMDYAIQTGITQSHQIGASMGTDKMRSYISFGYLDQTGVEKGQSYTRYSALLSLDLDVNKRIRIGGSLNGMVADQEFGINTIDLARGMLPFTTPYDTAGEYDWLPGDDSHIVNFIRDIENERNNRKSYHMRGSFYGEVDIVKGLKYRINFGPDFRQYRNGTFQSAQTTARWGSSSYARYFQDQSFNWTLENLLYYDLTISDMHTLGITVLQSAENYKYEYSHVSAQDLPYDEQLWYDLRSSRAGEAKDYGSSYEEQSRQSFMGRLNYGLMDKYLLTVSGRWDGASVLAPGNKWQFFPSLAVAWKMQEESFMKDIAFITESKIRVGWGVTGNSLIPPYQASGSIVNWNYCFGKEAATGYRIETPPNAELNWERTTQINIGYDFSFFRNRLRGSIDLYNANTDDLLMNRTIPVVNGANHVYFNIGKTRNRGIEIMLSTVNISAEDFSWRTDFTFSKNINEIVELYGGKNDDIANRWFIGEPISVNYGYEYDGIWQESDSVMLEQYYGAGGSARIGTIRIKDLDTTGGEYVFNSFDQRIRGSNYPDFISGMTNYITYKGFELSFFFYARVGQTIRKLTPLLFQRYRDVAVDYWTPTNTNAIYPWPKTGNTDTYMSSLGYQKGSFLKVRNISLKYNLPESLLSKVYMSNLAIKVQLLNPFLFTDAVNVDPDLFTYEPNISINGTKSVVFGINVGF
jgi:TonB-linked SusC/RagA family outer membrane protein